MTDHVVYQLSLFRLNYQWPECEVHPAMVESVAARHLCLQRGLTGGNKALQLLHSYPEDSQKRGQAGLQASAWHKAKKFKPACI